MKKAQFAMEYLLVVGFSLMIMLPITVILYKEYDSNKQDVQLEHLTELSRELVYQAEKIYYQGAPSRTTVEAYFPPQLEYARVEQHSITFKLKDNPNPVYADTTINLTGSLQDFRGTHLITLQVDDNDNFDPKDDVVVFSDR